MMFLNEDKDDQISFAFQTGFTSQHYLKDDQQCTPRLASWHPDCDDSRHLHHLSSGLLMLALYRHTQSAHVLRFSDEHTERLAGEFLSRAGIHTPAEVYILSQTRVSRGWKGSE